MFYNTNNTWPYAGYSQDETALKPAKKGLTNGSESGILTTRADCQTISSSDNPTIRQPVARAILAFGIARKVVPPTSPERVQAVTTAEAVTEAILRMITSGELKPGDRLPTEEELCARFGVGRSSVREAKRFLTAKGIIGGRTGTGIFVLEKNVDEVIPHPVLHRLLSNSAAEALQEARNLIEIRSAELATSRADMDDLERMAACLRRMEAKAKQSLVDYQAGLDFHISLISATHNPVFERFYEVITDLLQIHQAPTYTAIVDAQSELEEHKSLYEAIAQRNAAAAVRLMERHLEYVRKHSAEE